MTAAETPRRPLERLLFFGWWSVVALLPIGHVTGLRNTWTVLVVIGTLIWLGRDAWRTLPARVPMILLLLWCLASIGWSTTPSISFGKWQTDLLIPLLAYAAVVGYVRRSGASFAIVGGLVTGMVLLALISMAAFLPQGWLPAVAHIISMEEFPNLAVPMPTWYPGVGDASMAASLAAAVLICVPRLDPGIARRWCWVGWIAVVVVVAVSANRNAAIAIPLVAVVAWLSMRRTCDVSRARWDRTRWSMAIVASLIVATGVALLLESGARERLRIIGTPAADDQSALVVLTERDTRPMIWRYYTRLAMRSPIVGVGFGRTVPGIHYKTQADRDLQRVEFNAYIHAHNLFLNWWLQTGLIGVVLLIVLLVAIVRHAFRRARTPADRSRIAARVAICAVLAAMLVRNATDDLLVYGMATLFWVLTGFASALATRAEDLSAPRAP